MSWIQQRLKLYGLQFTGMTLKHAIESRRSPKLLLLRILLPTILLLIFWGILQSTINGSQKKYHPIEKADFHLPKCEGKKCTTLLYLPPNDQLTYNLMKDLAEHNDPPLKIAPFNVTLGPNNGYSNEGYDVIAWYNAADGVDGYYNQMLDTILKQSISIQTGIVFVRNSTYYTTPACYDFNTCAWYNIIYNGTENCPFISFSNNDCITPKDYRFQTQYAVENALSRWKTGKDIHSNITMQEFPSVRGVVGKIVVQNMEFIFFYLATTISFAFILNSIAAEAETGMRGFLKVLGLKDSVYWFTWFLDQFSIYFLSMVLFVALGYALPHIQFFRGTDFSVILWAFFSYGVAFTVWSLAWSTVFKVAKLANIIGSILFVLGLGVAAFTASLGSPVMYYTYDTHQYWLISIWPRVLFLFPPWHLLKIIMDIVSRTNQSLLFGNTLSHYSWSDIHKNPMQEPFGSRDTFSIPSTAESIGYLWINVLVYAILIWYLDNVIPDSKKASRPPWFFVLPSYWGAPIGSRNGSDPYSEKSYLLNSQAILDEDIQQEKEIALLDHGNLALKIVGLTKYYGTFGTGGYPALNNFFFTVEKGTIVAILGHNGAGKTTLINILTGVTSPTHGDAYIFGESVVNNMGNIGEFVGVCPQFDILWGDLSANEHLRILRLLKLSTADADIYQVLRDVRLHNVADNPSSTFSGGMKRRLQVAISTLGNPKIIFLDEPTTGMDPRNRRHVWNLIQKIKEDKIICLTTHSMEEAEILGEKIGIMASGQLKCVGDTLHLKNKFCSGYRLSLITDESKVEQVKQIIYQHLPTAVLQESNAGSLIYSLGSLESDSVSNFLEYLQSVTLSALTDDQQSTETALVRDWGLSASTLEDVFLKVTKH